MLLSALDGPELEGPEICLKKLPKGIHEIWQVSKLINKLPNIYNKNTRIQILGASGIEIVIFRWLVDEFENGPNIIDTFWHFFRKKNQAHLAQAHLTFSLVNELLQVWHFRSATVPWLWDALGAVLGL